MLLKKGISISRKVDLLNVLISCSREGEMKIVRDGGKGISTVTCKIKAKEAVFYYEVIGKGGSTLSQLILTNIRIQILMNILFRLGRSRYIAIFKSNWIPPVLRGWLQYFSLGTVVIRTRMSGGVNPGAGKPPRLLDSF